MLDHIHYYYKYVLLLFVCSLAACNSGSTEKESPATSGTIVDSTSTKAEPTKYFPVTDTLDYDDNVWSEIKDNDLFTLEIRYATADNFMKQQVYDCGRCFLDNTTYDQFMVAAQALKSLGYSIILYDCYRPKPYQQRLWNIMPNAMYVTPPSKGSMHSRGRAIDMSLIDSTGNVVDMGTDYDTFGPEAHYAFAGHSDEVKTNRAILRETMVKHGFKAIRTEWWHFSCIDSKSDFSDWVWECGE